MIKTSPVTRDNETSSTHKNIDATKRYYTYSEYTTAKATTQVFYSYLCKLHHPVANSMCATCVGVYILDYVELCCLGPHFCIDCISLGFSLIALYLYMYILCCGVGPVV